MIGVERRIDRASRQYDEWYNNVAADLSLQVEAYMGARLESVRRKFGRKTAEVIDLPLDSPVVTIVAHELHEPQSPDISTA